MNQLLQAQLFRQRQIRLYNRINIYITNIQTNKGQQTWSMGFIKQEINHLQQLNTFEREAIADNHQTRLEAVRALKISVRTQIRALRNIWITSTRNDKRWRRRLDNLWNRYLETLPPPWPKNPAHYFELQPAMDAQEGEV